ncbi:MAG: cyclase family protein [Candidatus Tectomicrobia bacterium]|nr:cyclase family protein [Candidatus Tectomicrobia bacterium]
MKIIDLSLPLDERNRDFHPPRHPDFQLEAFARLKTHFRHNTKFSMSVHTGSHVEGPSHAVEGAAGIDQVPLDRFLGDGVKLDLRRAGEMAALDAETLQSALNGMELNDRIAVLHTGWIEAAPDRAAFFTRGPALTEDAARWLVAQGIKSVAVDFEIERLTERSPTHEDFVLHRIVLGGGVPIIEFVCNLHLLPGSGFCIIALPLPMAGADASPVRAVGLVD